MNVIHPGFLLAGLLSLAVPVVLHLLFRQTPRRVDIGSVRFLRVALKEQVRRRRVRRWLLLALRVAGLALLGFLFARPYLRGGPTPGEGAEMVLVIDRSASMGAEAGGASSFRRAHDAARTILAGAPEGSALRIGYADASGVRAAERADVERIGVPGSGATDHGKALVWARDAALVSRRPARRVVYLTDLQRSGPVGAVPGAWPAGVGVEVVDVGRPAARQVAVTDARVSGPGAVAGQALEISAVVTNAGALPVKGVSVRLSLEGPTRRATPARGVSLGPGASAVVRFPLAGLGPGTYRGSVSADPGDGFAADDRRWLAFEARANERVVVVDGEPGASVFGGETYYLETALRLRPPGVGASATPFECVRVARGGGSGLPALTGASAVVACNVGDWTDVEISALREYVGAGGRLVVFGGRRFGPEAGARLRAARLLPAEVLGASEPGEFRFATWRKDHPIFRALSDPQHGDLRRLVFRRVTRLKADPGAAVLAATADGDPLVLEAALGAGSVLVFAVAADRDWGDWPVSRLYLPMIQQIFGALTGRLPDDPPIKEAPAEADRPPGVSGTGRALTVRNLDADESAAERFTPDEFRRAYRLPAVKADPGAENPGPADPDAQRPDEVWRTLIWGLFAVLVAETFVANRTHA